jgi:hypothetical protein
MGHLNLKKMEKSDYIKLISIQLSTFVKVYLMFLFVLKLANPLDWTILERILFLVIAEFYASISAYGLLKLNDNE